MVDIGHEEVRIVVVRKARESVSQNNSFGEESLCVELPPQQKEYKSIVSYSCESLNWLN